MSRSPQLTIVLGPEATYQPVARTSSSGQDAVGAVLIGEYGSVVRIESTNSDALLNLADAFQEAARRLRAAQIATEQVPA